MVLYVLYVREKGYRHFGFLGALQLLLAEVNPWAFFASILAEDMITFLIVGTSFTPKG